jgi:DNA mismatch repair ATPase MutS
MQAALEQLLVVFRHLERWNYHHVPHLAQLCQPFRDEAQRPSEALKGIRRVVNGTGLRANPILWLLLNALMPWDLYFAYRLWQQKRKLADHLPLWLACWFEVESLSSLANFAYLNPHYTFPHLLATGEARLETSGLGHPLLPDASKVGNAFTITEVGQIFIFTGSNMAGKSTFLRTVGSNLCLAYAGGPVNATRLVTSLFRLYSCIRISDSVTDGISYFYGEVKCLKGLLVALEASRPQAADRRPLSQEGQAQEEERPLLYFIDEIFRGTNNRERLIGSRAYIRALVGQNGVGLIATHDLELAKLAEEIAAVHNYHFREEVAGGRMVFDYTLRPGPSPTTNALKIMALEGLPVESGK